MVNGVTRVRGTPFAPASLHEVLVDSLLTCSQHSVKVRITEVDNGQFAESNTIVGSTACSYPAPPCETELWGGGGEGEGAGARASREEEVDFPLDLSRLQPSPSRGASTVSWSVPRALAGAPFELSMFDVAGRKVVSLAKGTAEAGRFVRELSFRSDEGVSLRNGVFFVRLRIGSQSVLRTVVVSR